MNVSTKPGQLQFPNSSEPEKHVSNQALRQAWRDVLTAAEVPARRVYCLRHSRATHLLTTTGNLRAVADLLGDTIVMVEQRYAGRSVPGLRAALEQADAELGCQLVARRVPNSGADASSSRDPDNVN